MVAIVKRRKVILALVTVIVIAGAGLAAYFMTRPPEEKLPPLKIGGVPADVATTYTMVAVEILKRMGVDVVYQDFPGGTGFLNALLADEMDVGFYGEVPHLRGLAKEPAKFRAVGTAGRAGAIQLIVRSDKPWKSITEMKGGTIASSVGSTAHMWLLLHIKQQQMDLKDFNIVNMGFGQHITALKARAVDAIANTAPYGQIAEKEGYGRTIAKERDVKIPGTGFEKGITNAFPTIVRIQVLKEHPKLVQMYVEAQIMAQKFVYEHTYAAAKLYADRMGLTDVDIVVSTLQDQPPYPYIDDTVVPFYTSWMEILVQFGAMKQGEVTRETITNNIDLSFQQRAVKKGIAFPYPTPEFPEKRMRLDPAEAKTSLDDLLKPYIAELKAKNFGRLD